MTGLPLEVGEATYDRQSPSGCLSFYHCTHPSSMRSALKRQNLRDAEALPIYGRDEWIHFERICGRFTQNLAVLAIGESSDLKTSVFGLIFISWESPNKS